MGSILWKEWIRFELVFYFFLFYKIIGLDEIELEFDSFELGIFGRFELVFTSRLTYTHA